MRRKSNVFESFELIDGVLICVSAVILLFKSGELTFLYPVTFGLSAILCIMYGVDYLILKKGTDKKTGKGMAFLVGAVLLILLALAAGKVVFG